MKWCLAATILAAAAAAAFIGSPVNAALTIKRNTQDCIYPRIGADAERLWPTSKYLPKGPVAKALNGGFLADAEGFSIEYYGTYKIVTNKLINEKYLLYHCGTTPPATISGIKALQIPLTSASVADGTAADYATQLNLMDRVAYTGELVVSGCMQALAACGYIASDDPSKSALRGNVDAFWIWGYQPSTDEMSISFNAPAGLTPLARTKWLAYTAAFFNAEAVASALYLNIRDTYNSLRRAAVAQRGDPPLVCWVAKDWDNDFAMYFADYKVQYIKDAGGTTYSQDVLKAAGMVPKPAGSTTTLVFKNNDATQANDVASRWAGVLNPCAVIIDESFVMSTGGLTEMDATNPDGFVQTHNVKFYADNLQIPAVTAKNVYSLAGTIGQTVTRQGSPVLGYMALYWFERGQSRCDEVLKDLVLAISPTVQHDSLKGWTMKYLMRLDGVQQQQKIPAECTLPTAKLNNCVRASYAARICPTGIRNCDTGVMEFPSADKRCAAVSKQGQVRRQRRRRVPKVPECLSQPA